MRGYEATEIIRNFCSDKIGNDDRVKRDRGGQKKSNLDRFLNLRSQQRQLETTPYMCKTYSTNENGKLQHNYVLTKKAETYSWPQTNGTKQKKMSI